MAPLPLEVCMELNWMETLIKRNDIEVAISPTRPTIIIGERINPAGKEWLKEAL